VVDFDSTILPGREGSLTPQVKLTGLRSGPFGKSISVESNATNQPRLVLTMKGYILPVLDVSPTYLTIVNGTPLASAPELTLKTRKADLKIMELTFRARSSPGAPMGGWRAMLPVLPVHELTRPEKPDKNGYYEYKLKVTVDLETNEPMSGEFMVTTNHPDRQEFAIRGRVVKR
jgi:hypothetical protein